MGYFFVDDSVHDRGNFILGGVVHSENDLSAEVSTVLRAVDLTPGADEYKSRHRMDDSSVMPVLRESLRRIVQNHCSIGVIVAPLSDRKHFGVHALCGINHIIEENQLSHEAQTIYLDEGMFASTAKVHAAIAAATLPREHRVCAEQDSRLVLGLQVADLVAHTCSTMLLEHLGVINKTVKAGVNSGYDEDSDLEIGFALWAGIRYSFFKRMSASGSPEDPMLDATCGLFVADSADERLRQAAVDRFGAVWMGCIH